MAEAFPLTDMQKLLIVGASEGMEFSVRPHLYLEKEWPGLDPSRYREALNTALARHRRSIVTVTPDLSLQPIEEFQPVPLDVTDLRGLGPDETERALVAIREEMASRPLPFDRWPWLEFHVTRYGAGQTRLHVNFSNFFLDLFSGGTLMQEVEAVYHDPASTIEEAPPLREAALSLDEVEQGPHGDRARTYWMNRLDTLPEPPPLPRVKNGQGGLRRRQLELPEPVWSAIKGNAGLLGLTPTAAVLSVYAEVMSQWSGSRHFLLTNMMTRRMHTPLSDSFGNFSSVYPLEVDWRGDRPLAERAKVLQRQLLRDLARTHAGGFSVLEALNRNRGGQGGAVCPFVVAAGLAAGPQERLGFSRLETPQALIDHQFWELTDGSLWVVWDVVEAAFPPGLLDEMCAAYEVLVNRLAKDPEAWQESRFALVEQRGALTPVEEPPPGLLHDFRGEVIAADGTLSADSLQKAARNLAARLQAEGVSPGDRVAVILPKSTGQVVAVHAALTAGAAYVPMDPAWPLDRLQVLLQDAQVKAAITHLDLAGTICLSPEQDPAEPAGVTIDQGDLAYVIYTSGSTGRPKGVALDHRGPLNTIADVNRRFGVAPDDVVFGVSALSFDLSVYDLFCGATLVLPDPSDATPQAWFELMRRHRVTVWNSAPPLMRLLVDAATEPLDDLRLVMLSGDWIPVTLPDQIRRIAPNARIVSLGGATEASIWSIYHPIDEVDPEWTSIPYGRPLANQPWYVLDDLGQDTPTWTTGHLHIGGIGLALEYLGDEAKTNAAFVTHPRTGERIYRTGDLGRYLPDGTIELIGRADHQVKIQGYRIEPGEIEHVLLADGRVTDAVVLPHDSGTGKRLVAYVTAETEVDAAELQLSLAARLPAYMVPAEFVFLDRLPVTSNGKLDRKALFALAPSARVGERERVAPRTPAEAALLDVWQSVLGTQGFGVEDDFFEVGGHSFAALLVITRIRQELGVQVPLGALLTGRTIAGLAKRLGQPSTPLIPLETTGSRTPCFLVHPAGGTVFAYRELAARLDRPCYGFQVTEPVPTTVSEFADRYLAELRGVEPTGPYVIGGWSSGAAIALELAARLEDEVEQLVIFDSPAPAEHPEADEQTMRAWFEEDVLDLPYAPEELFTVFKRVVTASRAYRGRPINAPIRLIRARDGHVSEFADHPAAADDWGWDAFTRAGVTVVTVPGTHHTMLAGPIDERTLNA